MSRSRSRVLASRIAAMAVAVAMLPGLTPAVASSTPSGYLVIDADGEVHAFGGIAHQGSPASLAASGVPTGRVAATSATPSGNGYWVLDQHGGVFSFGDARFHGSLPALHQAGAVPVLPAVVGITSTRSGDGYWILDQHGGVFSFGDARFHGSLPGIAATGVVTGRPVGLAATPSGNGYWVLDQHGGVFSFGDARFHGSVPQLVAAGVTPPGARLVGIGASPSGNGYWILDQHGGVFSFGDARFHGSIPQLEAAGVVPQGAARPIGIMPTSTGAGYWMVGSDGSIFSFGDARFHGSLPGRMASGVPVALGAAAPGSSVTRGVMPAPGGKRIALTFDDGPDLLRTPTILATLRQEGVPATFFVMGGKAAHHPDIVRQAFADGHSIQNHTWDHSYLSSPSEALLRSQVDRTNDLIASITGVRPTCVRPPGGASSPALVQALHNRGLHTAMWTVDPFDWRGITAAEIVSRIMRGAHPDAVVVLHDRTNIVEALPTLIRELRAQGYSFSTVCDDQGFLPPERL